MQKIKKGDEVIVIAGKDKGNKGIVNRVLHGGKQFLVQNINTVKKHVKPNPDAGIEGGVVLKDMPIDRSNVMLYNAATQKGSRVGIKKLEDGRSVRYFKSNDDIVDV